jgi:hypothetical protein
MGRNVDMVSLKKRRLIISLPSRQMGSYQDHFSRASDQHFGYITLSKSDNPCELLSISTKQGTVHEFIDYRKSIVRTMFETFYKIYSSLYSSM